MIIYIAIYDDDSAYKIEAYGNDEAYDKAFYIEREINSELIKLYALSFKRDKLIQIIL